MSEPDKNQKLEKALREMARDGIFVPPARDAQILDAAREHFGITTAKPLDQPGNTATQPPDITIDFPRRHKPARRVRKPPVWLNWMPLAASIIFAGLMLYLSRPTEFDRADVNRDGTIDIIDAMLLAEAISAGRGEDFNRDGAVSEADAAELAQRVVDIERSGS